MIGWLTALRQRTRPGTRTEAVARRRRVLLVEDDVRDRERILPVLDALGFDVDIAVDADEGLRQGSHRDYAGAIVDLDLSETDRCEGLILIAELRECSRRYPIIILTHNSEIEYEIKGFEAGADAYVVKWPPREELRTRLGRLMNRPGNPGE